MAGFYSATCDRVMPPLHGLLSLRCVHEELTLEECDAILAFVNWRNEVKPESIAWDVTVYSDKYNYAGSIDFICKIDGKVYIVDFKTSQQVWPEYELQVSADKKPIENAEFNVEGFTEIGDIHLGILQIGYKRNKAGFKWNEIEDKFPIFMAAHTIWDNEATKDTPKQKDYPIVLSPAVKVEDALDATLPEEPIIE